MSAAEAKCAFRFQDPDSFTRWARTMGIRAKATRWKGGRGRPADLYDLADITDAIQQTGLAA